MIPRLVIDFKDRATPEINRVIAGMSPEKVCAAIGPRLRETVRNHIKRLPKNKKGWPSTGFWEDAARGTTWETIGIVAARAHGVLIRVNKIGFRQRYHGGVIRAVQRQFLTIPISAQAYGKTAADFPGAFLLRTKKGAYLAQYTGGTTAKGKFKKQRSTLEFLFKLQASVKQAEMPWIIPDATTMTAVSLQAMEERFRAVKAGAA